MHASIGHYRALTSTTGEVIQAARQLVAALGRAPGFVSYVLLDVGEGALTSISVFESRAELEDGDRIIGAWMAEHVPAPAGPPLPLEIGEIVVQRGM